MPRATPISITNSSNPLLNVDFRIFVRVTCLKSMLRILTVKEADLSGSWTKKECENCFGDYLHDLNMIFSLINLDISGMNERQCRPQHLSWSLYHNLKWNHLWGLACSAEQTCFLERLKSLLSLSYMVCRPTSRLSSNRTVLSLIETICFELFLRTEWGSTIFKEGSSLIKMMICTSRVERDTWKLQATLWTIIVDIW